MKSFFSVLMGVLLLAACNSTPVQAAPGAHRHVPGHRVSRLPPNHHRVEYRRRDYYFHDGVFYRPRNDVYVVVRPPVGLRVPVIPGTYISFGIGLNRYVFLHGVYYLQRDNAYEVVRKPRGADEAIMRGEVHRSVPSELVIYPKADQDMATMDRDRYECHLWAVHESMFDPSLPNQDWNKRPRYDRALAACLEGRDYVVK